MKLISVNIAERILDLIEKYVEKGYFPNRSEAIRQMIFSFIQKNMELKCPHCNEEFRIMFTDFGTLEEKLIDNDPEIYNCSVCGKKLDKKLLCELFYCEEHFEDFKTGEMINYGIIGDDDFNINIPKKYAGLIETWKEAYKEKLLKEIMSNIKISEERIRDNCFITAHDNQGINMIRWTSLNGIIVDLKESIKEQLEGLK